MIKNAAIVFTIYDGYEDLWDDAIRLIKKYWINHPQIYVFTNVITKNWDNVICVPVGADAEWSKKVQKAIEVVKEEYIILLLEDFYVGSSINDMAIGGLINYMYENQVLYCKLCDNNTIIHKPKRKYMSSKYEVIYADEEYGISLQPSVWNKRFLEKMVGSENYNAWVFEFNQVKNEKNANHTVLKYAIEDTSNMLNIKHGALQGKMIPSTVRYFKKIGDHPLNTDRLVMSNKEYLKIYAKLLGRNIVPKFAQNGVKSIAKKIGYSFLDEKWSK